MKKTYLFALSILFLLPGMLSAQTDTKTLRIYSPQSGTFSTDSLLLWSREDSTVHIASPNALTKMVDSFYWKLNGNSVTSSNFLGTVNNEPLMFKVDSIQAGIINNTQTGPVSYGLNALAANINSTGTGNTAFGTNALQLTSTGNSNSAFGNNTLYNNIGNGNTAMGDSCLASLSDGNHNIALGYRAGSQITTGSNNVFIGKDVSLPDDPEIPNHNVVVIGSDSTAATTYIFYGPVSVVSDRSMKHDIKPIGQGLDFVMKLKPSEFVYNSDASGKTMLGFIAQDVQDVLTQEKMTNYKLVQKIGKDMLGISPTELIPLLTKAVQEQQNQIALHQNQLNEQQKTIDLLLKRIETLENK